jgi:hypothetical protein
LSGFFSYKKKQYGAFFCAVQTYNGYIFAKPIANTRSSTLVEAVRCMLKVYTPPLPFFSENKLIGAQDKNFQSTRQILFDGESGLRSKTVQEEIKKLFDIKVYADPYWKRSFAERAILEVKLRMAVHLDFEGKCQ